MSTLAVVEEILRESAVPMSVREIVERAGVRLPSKSKTPDTVVARDLSMDIKRKGDGSIFVRISPGRYTMRDLAASLGGPRPLAVGTMPMSTVADDARAAEAEANAALDDGATSLAGAALGERAAAMRKPIAPLAPAAKSDKAETGFAR